MELLHTRVGCSHMEYCWLLKELLFVPEGRMVCSWTDYACASWLCLFLFDVSGSRTLSAIPSALLCTAQVSTLAVAGYLEIVKRWQIVALYDSSSAVDSLFMRSSTVRWLTFSNHWGIGKSNLVSYSKLHVLHLQWEIYRAGPILNTKRDGPFATLWQCCALSAISTMAIVCNGQRGGSNCRQYSSMLCQ